MMKWSHSRYLNILYHQTARFPSCERYPALTLLTTAISLPGHRCGDGQKNTFDRDETDLTELSRERQRMKSEKAID
jgi:hypothetical protein